MARTTSAVVEAAPVPDPATIERVERFTLERYVHAGETAADFIISAITGANPFFLTTGIGGLRWRLKNMIKAMQPKMPAVTNAAGNPAV